MFFELRSTVTTLMLLGRSQWRSRWGRSLLTMLSIAIAVMTIVGVWISGDATQAAYRSLSEEVEGPPAIELSAAEEALPISAEGEAQIASVAGITHMLPRLVRGVQLRHEGQRLKTLVAGIDPGREEPAQLVTITAGRFCTEGKEAILQASLAESLGLNVDDTFSVLGSSFTRLTLVGTFTTPPLQDAPAPILVPLDQAQEMFKEPGRIERYRLVMRDAAAREALLKTLTNTAGQGTSWLPSGWEAHKPIGRAQVPDDLIQSAELGLKFATAMGAVMATIIVFNTFLMNVNERRRQFAILRTIGATDSQVMGIVLGEATLLGLLGTAMGILFGWILALLITWGIGITLNASLPLPQLSFLAIILGGVAGPMLAMLGAYWPAREVCRISPLEGISHVEPPPQAVDYWRSGIVAGIVWGVGYLMMEMVNRGVLDKTFIVPSGTLAFAGLLLATPLVVSSLIYLVGSLVPSRPALRRLCNEQLLRRRLRTALTLSVLIVAIGNGLGVGHAIQSNIEDVRSWFRRLFNSEFLLVPSAPAKGIDDSDLQEEISRIAGVQGVASIRLFSSRVGSKPAILVARDHLEKMPLPYQLLAGNPETLSTQLQTGGTVLASGLANKLGLKLGDVCEVEIEGTTLRSKIVGLANDYLGGGNVVYIDRSAYVAKLPVGGADWFFVHAADSPQTAEKLREFATANRLKFSDQRMERANVERIMSGVVGALWSMLLIGFLVGGFAVANTLSGNILEQTRELGLLRVVGMTAGQAQRLCLRQALLLGLASLIVGLPIGVIMAAYVSYSNEILLGRPVTFQWHWPLVAGNIVAVLLVVVLAGWFPARRVTRLDLTDALSYE